ncbi:MAG: DNA polymerase III subunit delta [Acidimicrobiales bacterium]|nr:DNA polymerase III subunit delta [Acidimicrobiales bacterium]
MSEAGTEVGRPARRRAPGADAGRGDGETGRLLPAYLIRGPDPSLVDQASHRLLASLAGSQPLSLVAEEHDCKEADLASVVDACETPPLLPGRRVIVLRDAGHLPAGEARRLAAYLEHPLSTTIVVLVANEGTVPPGLVAAVRRVGEVVDAQAPSGRGRGQWLVAQLRASGVRADPAGVELLDRHLGEDLGRLSGLAEVLVSAYGEGAHLGPAEIEPFLGSPGDVAPWTLTDAIDRGDVSVALAQLSRLLEGGGRHPLVVLATLHRHYASMLRLDGAGVSTDNEAAVVLGSRSAFAAGRSLAQSRRLGWEGLSRALQLLAAADLDLRGATGWPGPLVLEILVARLCRLSPRSSRPRGRRG